MAGGRIRSIKPELLEDERVASLSSDAFRLFVGAILLADDYGGLRLAAPWLAGQVFWAKPGVDAEATLAELTSVGPGGEPPLVTRYRVRGQLYGHVTGWEKHQKVDKPGKPRVPRLSEADTEALAQTAPVAPVETLANDSRVSRESLATDLDLDQDPEQDPERDLARARARLGVPNGMGPEAEKILMALDSHPALRLATNVAFADELAGRAMARGSPVSAVLDAISDAARDAGAEAAGDCPMAPARLRVMVAKYADRPPRLGPRAAPRSGVYSVQRSPEYDHANEDARREVWLAEAKAKSAARIAAGQEDLGW